AWEVRFVLQALQEAGLSPGWRVLMLGGASPAEPVLTALGAVVSQAQEGGSASGDFDACISCAVAGHQGSIAAGSAFLVNSVKALRVGGSRRIPSISTFPTMNARSTTGRPSCS